MDQQYQKIEPSQAYIDFFEALSEENVEAIIQRASELFTCPVLLTDENYRLVSQYPRRKMGQDIWDTLYETGTLPMETIWDYQKAFLQKESSTYTPFYADYGLAKEYPRIFGEVYTKTGEILGHIAIFMMGRPLFSTDIEVTQIFVEALRIHLAQRKASRRSASSYLEDLLNPEISTQRKILARRVLSKQLKGYYSVIVMTAGSTAAQKAFTSRSIHFLNQSFDNTMSTVYDDYIVTVVGNIKEKDYSQKERNLLFKIANSLHQAYTNAGVSNSFKDLSDINAYYEQALLIAKMERNEVVFFDHYASSTFFLPTLEYAPVETYIHPILWELLDYDKKHDTQYFMTLRMYSLNMHNKESTSRDLCIHRNTLLYRLNRIQEIFNLAIEDKNIALHILNSYQLWDVESKIY